MKYPCLVLLFAAWLPTISCFWKGIFEKSTTTGSIRKVVSKFHKSEKYCQASGIKFNSYYTGKKNVDHIIELQVLLDSYHNFKTSSGAYEDGNPLVENKMKDIANTNSINTWPIRSDINQAKRQVFTNSITAYHYGGYPKFNFYNSLTEQMKGKGFSLKKSKEIATKIKLKVAQAIAKMKKKCDDETSFKPKDKSYCKRWLESIRKDYLKF